MDKGKGLVTAGPSGSLVQYQQRASEPGPPPGHPHGPRDGNEPLPGPGRGRHSQPNNHPGGPASVRSENYAVRTSDGHYVPCDRYGRPLAYDPGQGRHSQHRNYPDPASLPPRDFMARVEDGAARHPSGFGTSYAETYDPRDGNGHPLANQLARAGPRLTNDIQDARSRNANRSRERAMKALLAPAVLPDSTGQRQEPVFSDKALIIIAILQARPRALDLEQIVFWIRSSFQNPRYKEPNLSPLLDSILKSDGVFVEAGKRFLPAWTSQPEFVEDLKRPRLTWKLQPEFVEDLKYMMGTNGEPFDPVEHVKKAKAEFMSRPTNCNPGDPDDDDDDDDDDDLDDEGEEEASKSSGEEDSDPVEGEEEGNDNESDSDSSSGHGSDVDVENDYQVNTNKSHEEVRRSSGEDDHDHDDHDDDHDSSGGERDQRALPNPTSDNIPTIENYSKSERQKPTTPEPSNLGQQGRQRERERIYKKADEEQSEQAPKAIAPTFVWLPLGDRKRRPRIMWEDIPRVLESDTGSLKSGTKHLELAKSGHGALQSILSGLRPWGERKSALQENSPPPALRDEDNQPFDSASNILSHHQETISENSIAVRAEPRIHDGHGSSNAEDVATVTTASNVSLRRGERSESLSVLPQTGELSDQPLEPQDLREDFGNDNNHCHTREQSKDCNHTTGLEEPSQASGLGLGVDDFAYCQNDDRISGSNGTVCTVLELLLEPQWASPSEGSRLEQPLTEKALIVMAFGHTEVQDTTNNWKPATRRMSAQNMMQLYHRLPARFRKRISSAYRAAAEDLYSSEAAHVHLSFRFVNKRATDPTHNLHRGWRVAGDFHLGRDSSSPRFALAMSVPVEQHLMKVSKTMVHITRVQLQTDDLERDSQRSIDVSTEGKRFSSLELPNRTREDVEGMRRILLSGSVVSTLTGAARYYLEEPVPLGMSRIRWKCRCGKLIYDDYLERKVHTPKSPAGVTREFAGDQLGTYRSAIRGTGAPSKDLVRTEVDSSSRQHGQGSGGSQSSRGSVTSRGSIWTSLGETFKGFQKTGPILPQHDAKNGIAKSTKASAPPKPDHLEFLLLCIPFKSHAKKLMNIDTTTPPSSDMAFFRLLRQTYAKNRGRSRNLFSIRALSEIRFVQFEVFRNDLADVRKFDCIPPEAQKDNYLYRPMPAEFEPPIGKNQMRHLYDHPDHADDLPVCYSRVPRKLRERLSAAPGIGRSDGWGICFIEGVSWPRVCALGLAGVLASTIFGVVWTVVQKDIQGGFGVASYMLGVLVLGLGALQGAFEM
jgi:hypothetical protein